MESFEGRFKTILAEDVEAANLVDSLVSFGFDGDRLLTILGEVSDPQLQTKLKRGAARFIESASPTRKKLRGLARRLAKDARVLERYFAKPLLKMHPKSSEILKLAKTLHRASSTVQDFPLPNVSKSFSYRAFWQRLPVFLLCEALGAPEHITYVKVQKLLVYAYEARGRRWEIDRSINTRCRRFKGTPQCRFLLDFLRLKVEASQS